MTGIIQKSLHGIKAFVDPNDILFGRNAIATGGRDKPMVILPGSPDTVVIWDDFIGDTGRSLRAGTDPHWRVIDGDTGNDTGGNVVVTPGTSGILRINTSTTNAHAGGATAAFGHGIVNSLSWKGNQGSVPTDTKNGLRFGTRLKANTYTDTGRRISIFAGFTDTIALESPIADTGGAPIAVANDAVGFVYGAGGDTGWSGMSVNGGGTVQVVALDNTRQAFRAGAGSTNNSNVYDTLELEVHHGLSDTGGTVTFYVNGQNKGSISAPIAMNVALTPIIYMYGTDTGGGQTVDVDWINVSAPRDSGT
jgi:hypothetical protein